MLPVALLFVDISKPQSLTTKTVALHGVYNVVYISLHSAHAQINTCYYNREFLLVTTFVISCGHCDNSHF